MDDAVLLVAQHRRQVDVPHGVEQVGADLGAHRLEGVDELLHFLPLGGLDAVGCRQGAFFRELAGALEEGKAVFVAPPLHIVFADVVEGTQELHAGTARAGELRQHGADLAGVENAQEERFDGVIEVMSQGDLAAAQAAGLAVQEAPAHAGAQIAGRLFHVKHGVENIRLEKGQGNAQKGCVVLDGLAVRRRIARIHAQVQDLEGELVAPLQLLEQLGQQHGILAAGNTHGNLVAGLDHVIIADGLDELVENLMLVFGAQGRLDVFSPFGVGPLPGVRSGAFPGRVCLGYILHGNLVLFQT